jgi:hypothetical protein
MQISKVTASLIVALSLVAGTSSFAGDDGWVEAAKNGTIVVYNREKPGSEVKEVRGIGTVKGEPWMLKNVIDDVGNYKDFMPYTKDSKFLKKEGTAVITYQRLDAPLISNRDYTLRIEDLSRKLDDGRIVYKNAWKPASKLGPAPIDGVVRVEVNEGYWQLEEAPADKDGTKRTKITYYVFTNPGGSVPSWIVNAANNTAIPDLFAGVEKAAKWPKYQQTKPALPGADAAPATTSPAPASAPAPSK